MKSALAAKKHKNIWLLGAFLIPFVGMLVVMIASEFHPFGKYSMLYSDMYHQYYPFFLEYRRTLREGGSLLWNWTAGMGMDYLALISYYLASPLYLLSVFVPEAWLLDYFSLLTPIKLGFAGLFFAIFLREIFRRNDVYLSFFGAFYALCAWAMGFQWNIMWMDTFALLPLVVLGTIRLLRDKKFVLYTLSLFLAVFSNYYIGFFVCIFVLLTFLGWEICRWSGVKRFFSDLCRIALFSALAIGMTAILELPAYMGLKNTQSSVNSFPTKFLDLNMTTDDTWKGLFDVSRQVVGNVAGGQGLNFKEGLPNLYCGIVTIILAGIFFTDKKIRVRDKIFSLLLLAFFTISFIVRMLDYIWHGFHFTNMIPYRFSFLFSFVLLVMAYRALIGLEGSKIWKVLFGFGFFLAVCAASDNRFETAFLLYNLPLGILYCLVFLAGKMPKLGRFVGEPLLCGLLCVLMAVEIIMNLVHFGTTFVGTDVSAYPRGTTDTYAMVEAMKEREAGTLFYRSEVSKGQALNDDALLGLNGVSTFSSSANVRVTRFMQAIGFGAKNTYNRYCYEYGTPVQNLFLGVKYVLNREGYDQSYEPYFTLAGNSGNVYLWENSAYLPLGFLVEPELAEVAFDENTGTFALQNQIFAAATGLDSNVYQVLGGCEYEVTGTELTGENDSGYCTYSEAESGASVTIIHTIPQDGYFCTRLSASKNNSFSIYINDQLIISDAISLDQTVGVGYCMAGDTIKIKYTCKSGENGRLTATGALIRDDVFQAGYEVLAQNVWELTSFSDTQITGTITGSGNRLLYTSIPYDAGWTATVDGAPADITLIGDCMMAIALPDGDHVVSFSYHNSAFDLGWKISLGCLVIFAALWFLKWKFGRKAEDPKPYEKTRLLSPVNKESAKHSRPSPPSEYQLTDLFTEETEDLESLEDFWDNRDLEGLEDLWNDGSDDDET